MAPLFAALLLQQCHFLRQAGHSEKAVSLFQAMVDFTFFKPDSVVELPTKGQVQVVPCDRSFSLHLPLAPSLPFSLSWGGGVWIMGAGVTYLNTTCSFLSVLLSNVSQNILVPQGKFRSERMKHGEMKDSPFSSPSIRTHSHPLLFLS